MRDSNQYNIGGISSSQKGVDNLVVPSDCCLMKTITLLAVLFASSAFAAPVFTDADVNEAIANHRRIAEGSSLKATDLISSAPSIEASKPMKVDYTIVTLPDGKTASALTFK